MLNVMRISIGVMIMFCTFKIAGRNLIVSLGYPHPCSCFSTNFFGTFLVHRTNWKQYQETYFMKKTSNDSVLLTLLWKGDKLWSFS